MFPPYANRFWTDGGQQAALGAWRLALGVETSLSDKIVDAHFEAGSEDEEYITSVVAAVLFGFRSRLGYLAANSASAGRA